MSYNMSEGHIGWIVGLIIGVVTVSLLYGSVALYQPFKVWVAGYDVQKQRLIGEAEFARAEQNRMILVEQARAEKDAAMLRAEAIEIVGEATQQFPEYREQEFIGALSDALRAGQINQIMYLPTEAMLPITEAGHRPTPRYAE